MDTLRVLTGLSPRPRVYLNNIITLLFSITLKILRRFHCRSSSFYMSHRRRSSFLIDFNNSFILILFIKVRSHLIIITLSLFIVVKV